MTAAGAEYGGALYELAAEEGLEGMVLTTEAGTIGGIPAGREPRL